MSVGDDTSGKQALDNLSRLTGQTQEDEDEGQPGEGPTPQEMEAVLNVAAEIVGGRLFDMQVLISACGQELQAQIREEYEEED